MRSKEGKKKNYHKLARQRMRELMCRIDRSQVFMGFL